MRTEQYIWVIAYVDRDHLDKLQKELNRNNQYTGIEAQIPVVQVLKKKFKGKDSFDEVPLLFYYGFFKIPILWAINHDLLDKIKKDLTCITAWVKDPAKVWSSHSRADLTKPILLGSRDVPYATATSDEVSRLIRLAKEESIHSSDDIDKLEVNSIITLMGYPFEGMEARVESIDRERKKVKVVLKMSVDDDDEDSFGGNPITVSFDNVFYSIYRGSFSDDFQTEKPVTDFKTEKQPKDEAE